jgi:hypothetical protein
VLSTKAILFGTERRPGEGISAGLWATWALASAIAAVGGLITGTWWAALFVIPSALMFAVAIRRARERSI